MSSKIHIFLSYRTKSEFDVMIRDELEKQCGVRSFKLSCDESATKEGENLITFMEDLTSARCVFLLLSPEYFQSAYTLFELVQVSEQADQDNRFIFPVRSTNSMCTYVKTTSEEGWNQNRQIRNELCRLLGGCSEDEAWQRVSKAWETINFPYLDEVHKSLEESSVSEKLAEYLDVINKRVEDVIETSKKQLQEKICTEIVRFLKRKNIPSHSLATELGLDVSATENEITKHMVYTKNASEIVEGLDRLSREEENKFTSGQEKWSEYLFDIEQVCGWLLINSVDAKWWFQHELRLKQSAKKMTSTFALDYPPYIEVIISRRLLQQACYTLDEFGAIKPAGKSHDVMLFDAISSHASDIELLTPVYKDLRRIDNAPQNVQKLLDDIYLTARSLYKTRNKKPVYYIVSKDYLELLQKKEWFAEAEQKLAGYLQFICCEIGACEIGAKSYETSPCPDEQDLLLEHLANILRLRNKKG